VNYTEWKFSGLNISTDDGFKAENEDGDDGDDGSKTENEDGDDGDDGSKTENEDGDDGDDGFKTEDEDNEMMSSHSRLRQEDFPYPRNGIVFLKSNSSV
jgi:hypothetical protein